jgi:tRNA(His) guanylyltransferase
VRDDLGDRMKADYEQRTRVLLPRRTYTIVRVDGKAFHQYTKGLTRPFDFDLMADMDTTAIALCKEVTGCAFAYVQSDEISLLLTDFSSAATEAWFDGSLQKIVSITASIATAAFNRARLVRAFSRALEAGEATPSVAEWEAFPMAQFDSRAFTVPDVVEVANYFLWRQQDATRNSISMATRAEYPHEAVDGKSTDAMQEMLWQRGINWNDYPDACKRGRMIVRNTRRETVTFLHKRTGEALTAEVERNLWQSEAPPVFSRDRSYLADHIPKPG